MIRKPRTFDNDTGRVIDPVAPVQLEDIIDKGAPSARAAAGLGPTRKMLDTAPIHTAPWLTPELAEQEMAIGGFK